MNADLEPTVLEKLIEESKINSDIVANKLLNLESNKALIMCAYLMLGLEQKYARRLIDSIITLTKENDFVNDNI